MTIKDASLLVTNYESKGSLPDGFDVDRDYHTTLQGDKYEIVQISKDNTVVITYEVKNGQTQNITLV
jgi:hypothetical protein